MENRGSRMRKYNLIRILGPLLGFLFVSSVSAQSFSEWFRQKKTQKKYLLAQIAALETYRQAIAKGCAIAKGGLALVTTLKSGDLLQHQLYFRSRELVSPRVSSYSRVQAIKELAGKTNRLLDGVLHTEDLNKSLSRSEMEELLQYTMSARSEMNRELETLQLVVTGGQLRMTDDERISCIDRLYNRVRKKSSHVLLFVKGIQALTRARKKAAADTKIIKRLSGR